ncbi:Protein C06H5.6 a [Aphelenchoides avenae]|nr:Protein C06H5.6 a [Aphelenchus avenae]
MTSAAVGHSVSARSATPALYTHLDAEKVLDQFGKYGKYQMIIYAITNLAVFLFACETMVMSLISVQPEFGCELANADKEEYEVVDKCTVRDSRNTSMECGSNSASFFAYNGSYQTTYASEFNLTCSREYWTQHPMSVFILGGMITTPFLTQLADRYGRRYTYLVPLWVTVLANIACSLAPSYYSFLFFRFVAGLGTGGIGIGYVIQLESVAPSFRSITPLATTFVWVGGYMLVGVLHMFIGNWRWLYFALSAPGLITFTFYWCLPESIHWLITHRKVKEVTRYIRNSSRINKVDIALHECKAAETRADIRAQASRRTYVDLFRSKKLLFHLILQCYVQIVMNGTYWALSLFSVDLHEDEMIGYFLSGFVELPAGLIAIALLLYVGRRSVTVVALVAQSISMFAAVLFPGKNWLSMSFPLLAKMFNSVVWTSHPLLLAEMSPTSVRNIIFGCVSFVGEIGSVAAPYLNVLREVHEGAPAMVIAAMSLVAAFAVAVAPETKDKPMPEDIGDFDAGMEKLPPKGDKTGSGKKLKKGPSSKQSDDDSEKDKKRRSSLGDSPVTSSSSSTTAEDVEPRVELSSPRPSKVEPEWRGNWLKKLNECIVDGDHTNFVRRVRMVCIALRRRNASKHNEAGLVQIVLKSLMSQFYVASEQTTLLMTLVSSRDVTRTCEKNDHGYCRIARLLLNHLPLDYVSSLLQVRTRRSQKTALHCAVLTGELCQLRVLLEHDVDPNVRDSSGRSAIHYALERNNLEMVKLLMWYGADISQCPKGRFHHPPRLLALGSVGSGENMVGPWLSNRVPALENQFISWVKRLCGDIYHVMDTLSEVHFMRLSTNSDYLLRRPEPFVQRSYDLNIRKDLHRRVSQPNEVAILFVIPAFFDVKADEHAPADRPCIGRTSFDALYSGVPLYSPDSFKLLPCAPLLAGDEGQACLEPALHPRHNGYYYAYILPCALLEGPYTVNFNMNLNHVNGSVKRVFLAAQAVLCREIDQSKAKLD